MTSEQHPSRKSKTQKTIESKLASLDTEANWQDKAACRGMDATIFFGPEVAETVKEKKDREDSAKAVCRTCDVRSECLDYALETKEPYGIWGGLSELERKQLLRRRPAT